MIDKKEFQEFIEAFNIEENIITIAWEIISDELSDESIEILNENEEIKEITWLFDHPMSVEEKYYQELKILNILLGGNGVNSFGCRNYRNDRGIAYIGMGDTYDQTILLDLEELEFSLGNFGDAWEKFEQEAIAEAWDDWIKDKLIDELEKKLTIAIGEQTEESLQKLYFNVYWNNQIYPSVESNYGDTNVYQDIEVIAAKIKKEDLDEYGISYEDNKIEE